MSRVVSLRLHSLRPLLVLPLAAGLAIGCARTPRSGVARTEVSPENAAHSRVPVTVAPHPAITQLGASGTTSIADVTERVVPSVVSISLTKLSRLQGGPQMFPFFFGPQDPSERREQQGMGSGVIVSSDGYILTNNHVVSDAKSIKVTLYDRREFEAEVVGTDPKSDVAVIRLKAPPADLKALPVGDSSAIRLGDVVLAIGNPFGVGQTVTMGIVSAKGRADVGITDYEDFIQTDAAINPGNSGGALVNMDGKLIGINTAILSRSGGYQGIGFAIPTNMATPIMESLKKYGKVTRGWLGVSIQDVDQELATAMKLPVANGVLLADVQAGSPAAKSGLRRGDVVMKVNGAAVDSSGQFRNAVASAGANRKVTLEIYRDGKLQSLAASLGEMPQDQARASGPELPDRSATKSPDGIGVGELTPDARRAFGIPDALQKGVVVTGVLPGSPAARAGLRQGDVLLEVNRKPVASTREFEDLYNKAQGNVLLLLHRRGATVFVVVRR